MSECNPGRDSDPQDGVVWRAGSQTWPLGRKALIMGILNVTPDSFSDGGRHLDLNDTLAAAHRFLEEGADILDIGGESTRPGAEPVSVDLELSRILPVIEKLAERHSLGISIDTCKPVVAEAALRAGANIVNDISGFRDPKMIEVCANSDCGVVVMHMQGSPQTMQRNPAYLDVVAEVRDFFAERFQTLTRAGIESARIVFDPGIGFGKTLRHNLALLRGVQDYLVYNRPILMGLSRKSFIGALLNDLSLGRREAPTQALTALTRRNGAMIHRVHQVKENVGALRMIEAVL
mgnify:FL=1